MKQILRMTFFTVAVLGATMAFTSCGSDNDDPKGEVVETVTEVNPLKVFTNGMPASFAGAAILKNIKGQVSTIKSEYETVTFEYKDVATTETAPQVIMTIEQSGKSLTHKMICNLYLNKDGFVKHCDEVMNIEEGEVKETWDFTYNNDGQLLTMLRSEGGNEKTTVKYNGGNIVETATVSAGKNSTYNIFYTSESVPTPIVNKGCMMLFDQALGIDMDEMKYAYYAGLLGKATKNLPVSLVDEEGDKNTFTWTLNAQGYPTLFEYADGKYAFAW